MPAGCYGDGSELDPVASLKEQEGLTLVVPQDRADVSGLNYEGVFRWVTLEVHSSLQAVGLTAAVSAALSQLDIAANVIAAAHHDHVFVPADRVHDALQALKELARD